MNEKLDRVRRGLLWLFLLGRWAALLAVARWSLYHWFRSDYIEYSGLWQYGLPLLDPRVASALEWWVQDSAFLILILFPLARAIHRSMPRPGALAVGVLALGLGSRGFVAPLLWRSALASPLQIGTTAAGLLADPAGARWAVALADACWLLPLLIVGLQMVRPQTWWVALMLSTYALVQAFDAPYLMTAGGPRGATMTLNLIAFQEGFSSRSELGYASVLAVLMAVASLPAGLLMRDGISSEAPPPKDDAGGNLWLLGLGLTVVPVAVALVRNPPSEGTGGPSWIQGSCSLAVAALAGLWTAWLARGLAAWWTGCRPVQQRFLAAAAWMPALAWILALLRPLGSQAGVIDGLAGAACLIVGAPYLWLATFVLLAIPSRGLSAATGLRVAAAVAAWATFTDLSVPLLITQARHFVTPLPYGMAWDAATHLWRSPLSVAGWPLAWLLGSILAAAAVVPLYRTSTA